jgi:hypothetical protein
MNKLNQKLSEVLDVEPIKYTSTEIVETKSPIEDDADFARSNIRDLIQKGNVAIDNLLQVANASEHPRAYEVAAGLIKNLGDLNKDLMEIQKRKRDLDPTQSKNNSTTNIDKAVFVGSTTDLVKFLKNNKHD